MRTSETVGKLAAAMVAVQKAIKNAKRDADNPYYGSKYADLAGVWEVCRKELTDNGVAVIQGPESSQDGLISVVTRLQHTSGEFMESCLTMKPVKADPQGFGSAITYARRYALAAMVGVATEDDDGNAASQGEPPPAQRTTPARAASTESKKRFSNAVLKFSGVKREDLGPAAKQVAARFGHKSASGLADAVYEAMAIEIEKLTVPWAEWNKGAKA